MRIAVLLLAVPIAALAQIPPAALKYRGDLTREAHFSLGLRAPIPMLAGQIEQESSWRPGITSFDSGRGLAQMMDGTGTWLTERYPDLGTPQPYHPLWAIRAMVRLNAHNLARVVSCTPCHAWGAALKSYNAGGGYVTRAQKISNQPGKWFGNTEFINAGQSTQNFEASRLYPRKILLVRQKKYLSWGDSMCKAMIE